jgi:hypothetical protein
VQGVRFVILSILCEESYPLLLAQRSFATEAQDDGSTKVEGWRVQGVRFVILSLPCEESCTLLPLNRSFVTEAKADKTE